VIDAELVGLFASSFAAATILPLASEVPLVLLVERSSTFAAPVLVATIGNYLGACTTYVLARAAAARLSHTSPDRHGAAFRWFHRYGAPALLLSWLPIVGDGIVVLAGAARVPFGRFSLWTVVGKGGRYAAVAWLAMSL
jgi:membrane protein YqaA with SNARE-associated domain